MDCAAVTATVPTEGLKLVTPPPSPTMWQVSAWNLPSLSTEIAVSTSKGWRLSANWKCFQRSSASRTGRPWAYSDASAT
jgi:hypothetical protein